MNSIKESNKRDFLTSSTKIYQENNQDTTIFNLNEFKDYIINNYKDYYNHDLSISLERPFLPHDIQQLHGAEHEFDSDGYVEEDDEDTHEKLSSKENIIKSFNDKEEIQTTDDVKYIVTNHDEMREILCGHKSDNKYKLMYIEKNIKIYNEERCITIIQSEDLLIILDYFNEQLNSGLIELSDNFVEERRKYFDKDNDTYISIIKHFLGKKDDFFICVLNDIMQKLNIPQNVIDNTFHYYLELANTDEYNVIDIKNSYNKLFSAGVK